MNYWMMNKPIIQSIVIVIFIFFFCALAGRSLAHGNYITFYIAMTISIIETVILYFTILKWK